MFEVCIESMPMMESITYSDAIHYLQNQCFNGLRLLFIGSDMLGENWAFLNHSGFTVSRATIRIV